VLHHWATLVLTPGNTTATPTNTKVARLWKTCYIGGSKACQLWASRTGESVKPATEPLDAGQIIETTTRKRVFPAESNSGEPKTPDLWEYLAEVERKGEWGRHIVYIHRVEPSPSVPVQKCQQYLTTPDGQQVPICNHEEVEFALQRHYGGKLFRLMVKRGSQLITTGTIPIDAPVRFIPLPADAPPPLHAGTGGAPLSPMNDASATAQVAGRAMDALTNQERQSAEIGFRAMQTAAEVMQRFGSGSGGDDMTRQFMAAMMTRLMQDPMEQLVKLLTVMRELNNVAGGAPGANGMPAGMLEKIFGAMFERFMNPTPTGAPVSAMAEAVRAAPGLISGFAEVVREQRLLSDNQVKLTEMQRTMPGARSMQPNPQMIPPVPLPRAATPPPGNGGGPTMEFVMQKIVDILRQPVSAEQAADDVLAFLDPLDPNAVSDLAKLGETGLVSLFQNQPTLKPATNNMPRLVEFIRAFLKMHAEDVQTAAAEAQAKAPPLAN